MLLTAAVVSQLLLAIAVPYFLASFVIGVRVARRGGRLRDQERADGTHAEAAQSPYHVYFLVPCLNEGLVIGATVRRLLADCPDSRVFVIDDDSDDETADEARRGAAAVGAKSRLRVISRTRPDARLGKGEALNAAYPLIIQDATRRGLDADRVVVAVMDADGRLSPGATQASLPLFEDERIGAVQLIVRIRNRSKLICKFQDVEFWTISAISQFARSVTGTVSLGGNGQFTRLSALQTLKGKPWSRSLTEDLDLGLRLAAAGWRSTTTTNAYVDQQGVESYSRLMRQRTRWYQGHLSCISRLPELWASERLGQVGLIELTSFLLVPWLIVLPWSILQQFVLYQVLFNSGRAVFATQLGSVQWVIGYAVLWYLISFLPNLVIGLVYARRTGAVRLRTALLLGHLMILWNYIGYVAAWRAVARIVRRSHGWDKTTRTSDAPEPTIELHVPVVSAPVTALPAVDTPRVLRRPAPLRPAVSRARPASAVGRLRGLPET
jgi:cellulose synthase/poly-beta-1,6-N-acetylglucosamine synthase-like glycosyltransferase